jgi:Icc-related predicted phosphoesterase
LLDASLHYLQDSSVKIETLKIYGSPWQPRFFDWAFNLTRGAELAEKWNLIPDDTNILITHSPPFGILDEVPQRYSIENTGCEELRKRVETIRPRLHIFGHIHCGYGTAEQLGARFVNASICDESYNPAKAPIIVDL